jgi:hypothetical protein
MKHKETHGFNVKIPSNMKGEKATSAGASLQAHTKGTHNELRELGFDTPVHPKDMSVEFCKEA